MENANAIKIMVVEDEMIIGAEIAYHLSGLGYEVTGIMSRGEDALDHLDNHPSDMVILDIRLKGKLDGIETAQKIKSKFNLPIIYLTANSDDDYFNRARETKPEAFLAKPYKKLDLQRAIELTLARLSDEMISSSNMSNLKLNDCIFVRHKDHRLKLYIKDILYFESDRNYSKIFASNKEFLLATTLKKLEEKLPSEHFIRVHRSYIINLSHIDNIADSHLVISKKMIPVSKSYRLSLVERLRMI